MTIVTPSSAGSGEHETGGGGGKLTITITTTTTTQQEDALLEGTKVRKPYTITKQRERWTREEHQKFLEALKLYGRAWRRIEEHIGTKTTVQIRSHAQKFFSKVERDQAGFPGVVVGMDTGMAQQQQPLIDIPPPRPKRKPSHPYPRKAKGSSISSSSNNIVSKPSEDDTPGASSSSGGLAAAAAAIAIPEEEEEEEDAVVKSARQEDDMTEVSVNHPKEEISGEDNKEEQLGAAAVAAPTIQVLSDHHQPSLQFSPFPAFFHHHYPHQGNYFPNELFPDHNQQQPAAYGNNLERMAQLAAAALFMSRGLTLLPWHHPSCAPQDASTAVPDAPSVAMAGFWPAVVSGTSTTATTDSGILEFGSYQGTRVPEDEAAASAWWALQNGASSPLPLSSWGGSCLTKPGSGVSSGRSEEFGHNKVELVVVDHGSSESTHRSPSNAGGSSPTNKLHKLKSQLSGLVQKELSSEHARSSKDEGDEEVGYENWKHLRDEAFSGGFSMELLPVTCSSSKLLGGSVVCGPPGGGSQERHTPPSAALQASSDSEASRSDGGMIADNGSGGGGRGGLSSNSSACGNHLPERNGRSGSSEEGSSDAEAPSDVPLPRSLSSEGEQQTEARTGRSRVAFQAQFARETLPRTFSPPPRDAPAAPVRDSGGFVNQALSLRLQSRISHSSNKALSSAVSSPADNEGGRACHPRATRVAEQDSAFNAWQPYKASSKGSGIKINNKCESGSVITTTTTTSSGAHVPQHPPEEPHWLPKRTKDVKRKERYGETCATTVNWLTLGTESLSGLELGKDDSDDTTTDYNNKSRHESCLHKEEETSTPNVDFFPLRSKKKKKFMAVSSNKVDDDDDDDDMGGGGSGSPMMMLPLLSSEQPPPLSGGNKKTRMFSLSIATSGSAVSTVSSTRSVKYSGLGFVPYQRASSESSSLQF